MQELKYSKKMNQSSLNESDGIVEEASRYLICVLRHGSEISVDSRGWANVKDIRVLLRKEFPSKSASHLLQDVLEADESNRFQIENGDAVSFVRATRKHSRPEVDLIDPNPDESELGWYKFNTANSRGQAWVEATSKDVAKKLMTRRSFPVLSFNRGKLSVDDFEETDRDTITESTLKSALGDGNGFSTVKVHQSADDYLSVDVRSNMGGYKGEYVKPHPRRVRKRLPDR